MIKQKKGFWLFLFSLIPGAGEMYMGFKKQGISIMLIFWSMIALGAGTGMGWILMFLPILWFYSFFNVHNLKGMSEEDFYAVEDGYILHLDQFFGDVDSFIKKYRIIVAVLLIVFGISILWNNFTDILYWILPSPLANMMHSIAYQLPQIVIAIAILIAGFYILSDKKSKLGKEEDDKEEHYWAPYRPYQQDSEHPEQTAAVSQPIYPEQPVSSSENRSTLTGTVPSPETSAPVQEAKDAGAAMDTPETTADH